MFFFGAPSSNRSRKHLCHAHKHFTHSETFFRYRIYDCRAGVQVKVLRARRTARGKSFSGSRSRSRHRRTNSSSRNATAATAPKTEPKQPPNGAVNGATEIQCIFRMRCVALDGESTNVVIYYARLCTRQICSCVAPKNRLPCRCRHTLS